MTITDTTAAAFTGIAELPVDDLEAAIDNPRSDLGDLDELAASIDAVGIIQPIVVTELSPIVSGYLVVAGHRRLAAAKQLGMATVPCIYRGFAGDAERQEAMLVENLQRQDLSPLDEARGFAQLVELGHSQRQIAERVGCNQSHVSRRLSLTKLPDKAIELVRAGTIQLRTAEQLADVDDSDIAAVFAAAMKRSDWHLKEGKGVPEWAVEQAVTELTRQRKHAAAVATGKASKLKRITDDPRYYSSSGYEKCKKSEATAWFVANSDQSVTWARERSEPSAAGGPAPKQQWQLDREEQERVSELRAELLDRLRPADLVKLGVEFILSEFDADRDVTLQRISFDAGSDPLDVIAYAAVDHVRDIATKEPVEGAWSYAAHLAVWTLWADVERTVASYEQTAVAAPADTGVDVSPDAAEAQDDDTYDEHDGFGRRRVIEPDPELPSVPDDQVDLDSSGIDVDLTAGVVHNTVVIERPAVLQRSPWTGYRAAKEANVVAKIGRLTDREKVRDVIAYEWAGKNLRRPDVLAAAVQRLTDLDFEQGVG